MEFANGKIYANTFLKDGIMIINPENGAIEGVVDVRGLKEKVAQSANLDVLKASPTTLLVIRSSLQEKTG